MKHAREDYDDVQQVVMNGTKRIIPTEEPVFLIRGQDIVGGAAVRAWAQLAEKAGASPDIIRVAIEHSYRMDTWPVKKIPDLKGQ